MPRPGQVAGTTVRATAFQPVGWEGTTTSVRFVGGTSGGTPATGTFAAGDMVVDTDGTVHVCRVAGTPGSWSSSVTNNTAQTIGPGVKTFTAAPVVPSITFSTGDTLTISGGFLYFNGARVLLDSDIGASVAPQGHGHAYAAPASDPTNVDHTH